MKVHFILFYMLLLTTVSGFAQHNLRTYSVHKPITDAIQMSKELIIGRIVFFDKQLERKPLMFKNTKVQILQISQACNILSKEIEALQKEINTKKILSNEIPEGVYEKKLFTKNNTLNNKGKSLKSKIDYLYAAAVKTNIHDVSVLENFYTTHFKTDAVFYDFDKNEINYFDYYFQDMSNYGIMMSLNCLLLDIKTFQLLYYGTVMSY